MDSTCRRRAMSLFVCTASLTYALPTRSTHPSSERAVLENRSDKKEIATAVLAVTVAAGLLILLLLFLTLWIFTRGPPRFMTWAVRSRKTRSTTQLYHERHGRRSKGPREKLLKRYSPEPVQPDASVAVMEGSVRADAGEWVNVPLVGGQLQYQEQVAPAVAPAVAAAVLEARPSAPAPVSQQQQQQHQHSHYWALQTSTVELPSASTDLSIPQVAEVRNHINERPVGRFQPPVQLPPLNTATQQPAELMGSDESRYPVNHHSVHQGRQESWYQPSTPTSRSISPFGLEAGRALMDDPAGAKYLPSPATPVAPPIGFQTQFPAVGDEPWNTPYISQQTHSYEPVSSHELYPIDENRALAGAQVNWR